MILPVIVLPQAESDIAAAVRRYAEARTGYGDLFRLELDRTLGIVARWPNLYEHVTERLQRAPIHRFTDVVVYRVLPSTIRVVGVVSMRRDPAVFAALDHADGLS